MGRKFGKGNRGSKNDNKNKKPYYGKNNHGKNSKPNSKLNVPVNVYNQYYTTEEYKKYKAKILKTFDEKMLRYKADFHVHVKDNSDGVYTIVEVMTRAKINGVKFLGFLQHNNLHAWIKFVEKNNLKKFDAIHIFDGMVLIPQVEITCRDFGCLNKSDVPKPLKVHIMASGINLKANSPIVQLMELKNKCDKLYDYRLIYYIAKVFGKSVKDEDIQQYVLKKRDEDPGFNTMGKADAIKFCREHGIVDIAFSNKRLLSIINHAPVLTRLDLDMKDVIKIINVSGGVATLCHPSVNLKRTNTPEIFLQDFVDAGGMFIERSTNKASPKIIQCINDVIANNPGKIFHDGGGSDTHIEKENVKIGTTKRGDIYANDCMALLSRLSQIQIEREKGNILFNGDFGAAWLECKNLISDYTEKARIIEKEFKSGITKNSIESVLKQSLIEEQEMIRIEEENIKEFNQTFGITDEELGLVSNGEYIKVSKNTEVKLTTQPQTDIETDFHEIEEKRSFSSKKVLDKIKEEHHYKKSISDDVMDND